MSTNFQQGLLITAIGMGLVFAVIIFLWGLMALMMRLTSGERKPRRKPKEQTQGEIGSAMAGETFPEVQIKQVDDKRKAAAAAVAVALAAETHKNRKKGSKAAEKPGKLSPWQTVHRTRQLEKRR